MAEGERKLAGEDAAERPKAECSWKTVGTRKVNPLYERSQHRAAKKQMQNPLKVTAGKSNLLHSSQASLRLSKLAAHMVVLSFNPST